MTKVLLLSQTFPAYHERAGQPTFFVEQYLNGTGEPINHLYEKTYENLSPRRVEGSSKLTTFRKGNRWRVGDWFSPRCWGNDVNLKSGKIGPYNSKQIIIGEDRMILKSWKLEIKPNGLTYLNNRPYTSWVCLSKDDGLNESDLRGWMKYPAEMYGKERKIVPFSGQIITWGEGIYF